MGTNELVDMHEDLYLLLDSRDEADPSTASGVARLNRFLNWSYLRVQLPTTFEHIERQTTQTLTMVTSTASHALTVWAIDHIRYNNFGKNIKPMSRSSLSNTTIPSGQPSRWARWGSTLYWDYIPTSDQNGHTATVYGWTEPSALVSTASTAASTLNSVWDEVIVVGAAWRGWRSLGDHTKADLYREEYGALVNDNKSVLHVEGHVQGWRSTWGTQSGYM